MAQICGPLSAVYALQMPSTAPTSGGGGGTYTGGNVAQCQLLAQEQAAAIQQANSLQAEWTQSFLYGGAGMTIAQHDAQLATLQQEIAAAKARAISIGQQMQSLGCFG